jgi:hypothetical protein
MMICWICRAGVGSGFRVSDKLGLGWATMPLSRFAKTDGGPNGWTD